MTHIQTNNQYNIVNSSWTNCVLCRSSDLGTNCVLCRSSDLVKHQTYKILKISPLQNFTKLIQWINQQLYLSIRVFTYLQSKRTNIVIMEYWFTETLLLYVVLQYDQSSPTLLPGISVTAPIRRSTPWALIRKKFPFQRPWALPKNKIYVIFSVWRLFYVMHFHGFPTHFHDFF